MSADAIAKQIADRQGWTDATLLGLCLDYIDREGSRDAFADYLNGVAAVENHLATRADDEEVALSDYADADPDEEYGPYDWTCSHCGNALNEDNYDHTGSRRCDDLDPDHRYHLDLDAETEDGEDDDEVGHGFVTGQRVVWTDPDGGAEHTGTVTGDFHPEVVAVTLEDEGFVEARPEELRPATQHG